MEIVADFGGGVFLRLPEGGNHHDLGLFTVGAPAPTGSQRQFPVCTTWPGRSTRSPPSSISGPDSSPWAPWSASPTTA